MDAAAVVLCVRHRRDRLSDGLSAAGLVELAISWNREVWRSAFLNDHHDIVGRAALVGLMGCLLGTRVASLNSALTAPVRPAIFPTIRIEAQTVSRDVI